METQDHCTVSLPGTDSAGRRDLLPIVLLSLAVLVVHGYHPWAEDGGLYVASVESLLTPSLFPRFRAFATEPLGHSLFPRLAATLVRLLHTSLAVTLLLLYVLSIVLMLLAALYLARRCFFTPAAQWTAVALLAAWWTLPVAGTSLLLMDPYVTARTLSTPLSLWAVAFALQPGQPRGGASLQGTRDDDPRAKILCGAALLPAVLLHPLMAAYALGLIVAARATVHRRRLLYLVFITAAVLAIGAFLQAFAAPESPAQMAAARSRSYWFLSRWHWYEWAGLFGPIAVFAAALRGDPCWISEQGRTACKAAIALALLSIFVALLFGRERLHAYPVARLQPLRCFLLLYALMILVCGAALGHGAAMLARRARSSALNRVLRAIPVITVAALAAVLFGAQQAEFSHSPHLELPGRANPNPWVQAFLWSRWHTRAAALFALDARYIESAGEDAQLFRVIARRSALPDYLKDGGEAADARRLAADWQGTVMATDGLSSLSDGERDRRLAPFHVQWMVLHANAVTTHLCPYRNAAVKVCTTLAHEDGSIPRLGEDHGNLSRPIFAVTAEPSSSTSTACVQNENCPPLPLRRPR